MILKSIPSPKNSSTMHRQFLSKDDGERERKCELASTRKQAEKRTYYLQDEVAGRRSWQKAGESLQGALIGLKNKEISLFKGKEKVAVPQAAEAHASSAAGKNPWSPSGARKLGLLRTMMASIGTEEEATKRLSQYTFQDRNEFSTC